MESLDSHFSKILPLKLVSSKTRIPSVVIVFVMIGLALALSLYQNIGNLVVLFTGIFYPAIMSFNAIYNKETDDDKQWLTYWVLFSACNFLDYIAENIISWVPFYYTLKLCFVIYLFFPSTRGSFFIYEKFIFPVFLSGNPRNTSSRQSKKEE